MVLKENRKYDKERKAKEREERRIREQVAAELKEAKATQDRSDTCRRHKRKTEKLLKDSPFSFFFFKKQFKEYKFLNFRFDNRIFIIEIGNWKLNFKYL